MKKKVFGRHFKRDTKERKALFKGLLSSLVIEGRIVTTLEKAKAIRPRAEKLVTRAKKGGSNVADQMQEYMRSDAIEKLLADIAPRFSNRQGGYVRILRTTRRVADNAQMAVMEWTEQAKEIVKATHSASSGQAEVKGKKKATVASVEAAVASEPAKETTKTKKTKVTAPKKTKESKTK